MATDREEEGSGGRKRPSGVVLFLRDAAIAFAFVASILLAMFAYTGIWPPLVVVESDSMMHSEENTSYIGVIDTGDMVLVKDIDDEGDVVTYAEGFATGHKTYGDYGDVVVYKKMGSDANTPIIHRAIVYLEVNADEESYRCEALQDLPDDKWYVTAASDSWDHLTGTLVIRNVGYRDVSVTINIDFILGEFQRARAAPTSGFITRGDHNTQIDQAYRESYKPVDVSWIVGKARGEIPWFGLLKLWFTHSLKSDAPDNSVKNLWIAMAFIIVVPIVIDVVLTYRVRKRISRRREAAKREFEELTPTPPPPPEPSQEPDVQPATPSALEEPPVDGELPGERANGDEGQQTQITAESSDT